MSLLAIVMVAVGLSADAFAVSVAEGMAIRQVTRVHALRVALHFGGFQGIMPILGWLAGRSLAGPIGAYDHWVAFGLLAFIGVRMIATGLSNFEAPEERHPSRGARLLLLSIATSVDALAVGLSLAMLGVRVWRPAAVIGVVTAAVCACGVQMGDRVGAWCGRWAEVVGGVILCLIGLHILADHTIWV